MATLCSPYPARAAWSGWGVFAAAWLCAACGVSPKPEPPITVGKPPTLDDTLVSSRVPDQGEAAEGHLFVVGSALAVDPPGGVVRAFNLDDTEPLVDADVSDDGSFELELSAKQGDEVRLEVIGLEASSGPSDLTIVELGAALEPVEPPLVDCLGLSPGGLVFLAPQQKGEIEVVDYCGQGIELAEPRLRTDRDYLEIGGDLGWPVTLEKNEPITIQVRATEGEPGDEYVLFLEATAPQADRRAVSVRLE
ncbi:MAG: hypothetical protein JW940_28240 [Polyangiaceae bacterium]|nr:hypothetical protein [Polyangiaceae bacterium]